MAKANKRPIPRKRDTRVFIGTCSNCGKKQKVTKVANAQICINKCLTGVISQEE